MLERVNSDPLPYVLENYCNVNALSDDWAERVMRLLKHSSGLPNRECRFKQQLAEAILNRTITPAEYERLTDEDFDTPEDLETRLRELWFDVYGDEPVSLDNSQQAIHV